MTRATRTPRELVGALRNLAHVERDLGRRDQARCLYEDAVAVCREEANSALLAHTVRHLGDLEFGFGNLDNAGTCYREAISLYRAQSATPPGELANALRPMALLHEALGEDEAAGRLWEETKELYGGAGLEAGVAECTAALARLESNRAAVRVESVVKRKDPSLPRFVVVPSTAVAGWHLSGTIVVDVQANGVSLGRRNLKHWGKGRDSWFLDLTQSQCDKARVDTGDKVQLDLRRASTVLPPELTDLIAGDPDAAKEWKGLSQSRQRQVSEHIRSAKRVETRRRRARSALIK